MDECPVKHTSPSECPVKNDAASSSSSAAAAEAASQEKLEYNPNTSDYKFGQSPHINQKEVLQTMRAVSSIPKSEFTPNHQPGGVDRWVYPSEQQYFNAMKRKGYNPLEKDIPVILHIHNVVNEQGWTKVKEWEALRGNTNPRLKKFLGRPKDLTPKAFFLGLLG